MAGSRSLKRKSGATDAYQADDFVAKDPDDNSTRAPKRRKSTSTAAASSSSKPKAFGDALIDSDGNQYWELSRLRRVTISEFKGMKMVNVREYYEKDGKDLPGKKGISMTLEQYSAFIDVLPQIEQVLKKLGEKVPRPVYDAADQLKNGEDGDENDDGKEDDNEEEGGSDTPTRDSSEEVVGSKNKKSNGATRKKSNIEATSDEDED